MKKTTKPAARTAKAKTKATRLVNSGIQTSHDLKSAVLVVSLVINGFVACFWLALLITDQYDSSLAHFLLGR